MYADDTQVYGHCHPDQTECLSVRISNCVEASSEWMSSSRLQLNARKTEVMWCSSGPRAPELFQIDRHLLRPDPASTICPQPWDLARLRLFHDHSHQQNDSLLLSISQGNSSLLHSHLMCGSFSLHLLSYQRLITAIQLWSVHMPTASSNFSVSSTQLLKS